MDLKPIASTIACKLVECDDKTTTKCLSALNSNELEVLCTSNIGSHFMQRCLQIFTEKNRSVSMQSLLDKLKVTR